MVKFSLTLLIVLLCTMPAWTQVPVPTGGNVRLVWDHSASGPEEVAGYIIHIGEESDVYDRTETLAEYLNTYTVRNLPDGIFYFAVSAYDDRGNESGLSNVVAADVDGTPPDAPGNLRIEIILIAAAGVGTFFFLMWFFVWRKRE